jgi:hypothetical protein
MGKYVFRIFHDRYDEGATAELCGCNRVIYCVWGAACLAADGVETSLQQDEAWHGPAIVNVLVRAADTELWRWEVIRVEDVFDGKIDVAGISSRNAGVYTVEMNPGFPRMMRCDRVDFPPGGIAWHHIHAGPGVRSLLSGTLYLESGGTQWQCTPRSTWIEEGPREVYAKADDDEPTSFIRVMLLPRAYEGKSSISYVRPEEEDRPKLQQYKRYLDEFVEI